MFAPTTAEAAAATAEEVLETRTERATAQTIQQEVDGVVTGCYDVTDLVSQVDPVPRCEIQWLDEERGFSVVDVERDGVGKTENEERYGNANQHHRQL